MYISSILFYSVYVYTCVHTYGMFLRLSQVLTLKVLRGFLILYQVASRPDEMNCNVHETLASNHGSRHRDNPETSQHLYVYSVKRNRSFIIDIIDIFDLKYEIFQYFIIK